PANRARWQSPVRTRFHPPCGPSPPGLPVSRPHLFFSSPPPTSEIYSLSLHDALPIFSKTAEAIDTPRSNLYKKLEQYQISQESEDRKSTRLNSSHLVISYAVFCLKKKITKDTKSSIIKNDSDEQHTLEQLRDTDADDE